MSHSLGGAFLVLVILVAAWTLVVRAAPARKPPPAPLQNVPDGSTISGTLASDDWGLGTITVTGDITIAAGTVITIAPGTFAPSGYAFTLQDVDDGNQDPDKRDSDANPDTGQTDPITLVPGESPTLDAGVYKYNVPVGGVTTPVSALDLLAPWIGLAALVVLLLAGSARVGPSLCE